ncbi:MAG TPA: alkaline phytoceramidase [Gammaproteobacteria bacterium]|nr:alkaline phytoceramidase [Gammaproteobacteria bacterium]
MPKQALPALSRHASLALVLGLPALALVAVLGPGGPLPQDPAYHEFADRRVWLGMPRAGDVLTNLAFVFAGLAGLARLCGPPARRPVFHHRGEGAIWSMFFVAMLLTGAGSVWYHLAPDNARLVWDRLPMAAGFASLFCAALADRVDGGTATRLLAPLVALGVASVLFWAYTESVGRGDLRPYAFVQFYLLLAIPLLLVAFKGRYTHGGEWWLMITLYLAAKLAEAFDAEIFALVKVLSGHSLKHLLAAAAAFACLHMLVRRRPLLHEGAVGT